MRLPLTSGLQAVVFVGIGCLFVARGNLGGLLMVVVGLARGAALVRRSATGRRIVERSGVDGSFETIDSLDEAERTRRIADVRRSLGLHDGAN